MESNRQQKVSQLISEEFSAIVQRTMQAHKNILVTVTDVKVTVDLSIAKIYLSIFPSEFRGSLLKEFNEHKPRFRRELGNKLAKNLRMIPELQFYGDASLDQVEIIEKELKGEGNNPIL